MRYQMKMVKPVVVVEAEVAAVNGRPATTQIQAAMEPEGVQEEHARQAMTLQWTLTAALVAQTETAEPGECPKI